MWKIVPLFILVLGCGPAEEPSTRAIRFGQQPTWTSSMRKVARQIATEADLRAAVAANNDFAIALLKNLRGDGGQGVFISPASVSMALSMTMNGAQGQTLSEMQSALGVSEISLERLNLAYADIWPRLLQQTEEFTLTVANAIFAEGKISFEREFLDTNAQFYGAELQVLDFDDPASVTEINNWANSSTNGKIPKIVDELEGHMLICNAIYFNAKWVSEFDEDGTKEAPFTKADGSKTTVDMMYRMGTVPYSETRNYQAIRLTYKGGYASMVILLPRGDVGDFVGGLSSEKWNAIVEGLRPSRGHIYLPKFTTRFDGELKPALQAMGMRLPFERSADFGKLLRGDPVWIHRVIHKTFVNVAERGTEAAAVTAVEIVVGSAPMDPDRPFVFRADQPFVYAIIDDETGMILFLGIFAGP